jgi:NAD(P)-dependent dehydrogenase (short-subunit alcohol dehydrogenase family)
MLTKTIPRLTTTHLTTWLREHIPSQKGKTALVTGASDGIGFWIASVLAQFGAHVHLGCRNKDKGLRAINLIQQDHPKAECSLLHLDLTDPLSIERACNQLYDRAGSLDILINNAGISANPDSFTEEGLDLTFATNHLGPHILTSRLLPLIVATPAARVVTQSSLTHRLFFSPPNFSDFCRRYQPQHNSYAKSKLANLLFAHNLDSQLRQEGYSQRSLAAHPGLTFTNINRLTHTTTASDFLSDLQALAFNRIALRTANKLQLCQPFQLAAALPALYAAVCRTPGETFYFGPDGQFELSGLPQQASLSPLVHNQLLSKTLMHVTEKITGHSLIL